MAVWKDPVTILAIVLIGGIAVYTIYTVEQVPGTVTGPVPTSFTVAGRTYVFNYTATTEPEREAGLMNRVVTNSTTMLFAFPSFGKWQFWMFDTGTPLDMIWVNATGDKGVVVYVVASAQPCYDKNACQLYIPTAAANFVIEARGGFAASHNITAGTVVLFG